MLPSYFKNLSVSQKTIYGLIILFFLFNLSMLIWSFMIDARDIREMVKMARYISYIKYVVVINMVLFISIITIYYYEIRKMKKDVLESEKEMKSLKADLYDINKERSRITKE
jgi:hypothetical protein